MPRTSSAGMLRGEAQPRRGEPISIPPPVVVVVDAKRFSLVERLKNLIIENGEDSKEDHEEIVMTAGTGRQHGEHAGGDQRDNMSTADPVSAVNLGKHDLSCLTAVQGIDRQQVDQSPEQVDQ